MVLKVKLKKVHFQRKIFWKVFWPIYTGNILTKTDGNFITVPKRKKKLTLRQAQGRFKILEPGIYKPCLMKYTCITKIRYRTD